MLYDYNALELLLAIRVTGIPNVFLTLSRREGPFPEQSEQTGDESIFLALQDGNVS